MVNAGALSCGTPDERNAAANGLRCSTETRQTVQYIFKYVFEDASGVGDLASDR